MDIEKGAPTGGGTQYLPKGPKKYLIFKVSSVKLRDFHPRSTYSGLSAAWEDRGSLQRSKELV